MASGSEPIRTAVRQAPQAQRVERVKRVVIRKAIKKEIPWEKDKPTKAEREAAERKRREQVKAALAKSEAAEKAIIKEREASEARRKGELARAGIRATTEIFKALGKPPPSRKEKKDSLAEAQRIPVSTAVQQERYLKELEAHNKDVIAFNVRTKNLAEGFDWVETQGERLEPQIAKLDDWNKSMANLKLEASRIKALGTRVDRTSERSIDQYNNRVNNFNRQVAALEHKEFGVQSAVKAIDKYNTDVEGLNKKYGKLKAPKVPIAPPEGVGSFVVKAWEGTKENFREATAKHLSTGEKAKKIGALAATMLIPGVWAKDIKQMGGGQIAFNVAMDLILLRYGVGLARAGVRTVTMRTARGVSKQLLRQEAKETGQLLSKLKKQYGKDFAKAYRAVSKAQAVYFQRLVKLDKLKTVKTTRGRRLKQEQAVNRARLDLQDKSSRLMAEGKRTAIGFDSPQVAETFARLSKDIIVQTQEVAKSLRPTKVNIKALRSDLARSEAHLKQAQAKFPTDPTKWGDIAQDVVGKQSQLASALAGNVQKLQAQLIKLRATLKKKLTKKQRKRLEAEADDLEIKLDGAIKAMEVEASRSGPLRRGRVVTEAKIKPPEAPVRVTPGIRVKPVAGTAVAVVAKAIPLADLKLVMGTVTDPALREAIATETIKAIKTATALKQAEKVMTDAEIRARVREQLKEGIKPHLKPATKEALKTATKPITRVALKTAPKVRVPVKIRPKVALVPRIPGAPAEEKKKPWTKKEIRSAVAWKQGIVYWAVKAPYASSADIRPFKTPPKGMKISPDAKTAYETIQRLTKGKPPVSLNIDMGIMDIGITTPKREPGAKGAITFKRDPGQRTTGQLTAKRMRSGLVSKKRGRVFHTKVGGGTVLSRHPLGRR